MKNEYIKKFYDVTDDVAANGINSGNRASVRSVLTKCYGVPSAITVRLNSAELLGCLLTYNEDALKQLLDDKMLGAGANLLSCHDDFMIVYPREAYAHLWGDEEDSPKPSSKADPKPVKNVKGWEEVDNKPQPEDATAKALEALIATLKPAETHSNAALDEELVRKLAGEAARKEMEALPRIIHIANDSGDVKPLEGFQHENFGDLLDLVQAGVHVLMVGPAGSGKTMAADKVAEALELPFHFTGAVDSAFKLMGFVDAHGNYVSTEFRQAFEQGGLFLFDELDGSHASAVLAFNAALANGHCDFPDGTIAKHPDFRVVATANTYGTGASRQYVGRSQLDAASLDRFAVIDWDYDQKLERAIVPEEAHPWVDVVQGIRNNVMKSKLRVVVSPRASINGAKLWGKWSTEKLVDTFVTKGVDAETRAIMLKDVKLKRAA